MPGWRKRPHVSLLGEPDPDELRWAVRWPDDPEMRAWVAYVTVEPRPAGLAVTDLRINREPSSAEQDPAAIGLSGAVLRRVSLPDIVQAIRKEASRIPAYEREFWAGREQSPPKDALRRARSVANRASGEVLTRGPRGYGPAFYRWVATRYLDLQADPHFAGSIRKRIGAEAMERHPDRFPHEIPDETVKYWIKQARKQEFLPSTGRGVRATEPGPKLDPKGDKQ